MGRQDDKVFMTSFLVDRLHLNQRTRLFPFYYKSNDLYFPNKIMAVITFFLVVTSSAMNTNNSQDSDNMDVEMEDVEKQEPHPPM